MTQTLGELATRFDADIKGDADCRIQAVASLKSARPGQISFFYDRHYADELARTRASAVILKPEHCDLSPTACLLTENPQLLFARVANLFQQQARVEAGIHRDATVAASAQIDPTASVAARAVIADDVRIGRHVIIGAGCVIGAGSIIDDDSRLVANVSICDNVRIGKRVLVHPGAVIGSDGFGLVNDAGEWLKVPQLGTVSIGNDVEIGANTTIDRGSLDNTVIEDGVKLDNQIQVAHNVYIGAHTAIAGCVGIAGSTRIGRYCAIGGGVGISGHLEIADNVHVTAMSLVTQSITEAGVYSSGTPLQTNSKWRRNFVRFGQLDEMVKRLQKIEKKLNNY
ncbi:UDP-3-O-(3-hydroxymyristoyl)glucosamine N-acyltransferase [Sulfuriflexus sp.]|uniref:UDP-3-O-(3-hydroxymyristoyl)glucosamine N-acyltransferase n=1 Tax=Sulfuriflexus sp. TaxID=2015443 RepID=UPI0028CECFC2|nr:UDP-3-O-(3-hydroxymyristoyl)glucosamine N-acyltransferase [Sulfuriflexus sp.]MDT8402976.1 UDP-3-O-(3-hydroxymyristoyl)glucosamine N-acyltransferase [Sulfuriflexus sp.]